jgi:hypothetical protein
MALMDFLGGNFFGQTGYGDLMNEEQKKRMQQQALMSMGAQLLQSSGPSRTKTNLGQALGQAYLTGQQAYSQAGQNALAQMLTKQKIEEYQRERGLDEAWKQSLLGAQNPQMAAQRQAGMPPMPGLMAQQPMQQQGLAGAMQSISPEQRLLISGMGRKEGQNKMFDLLSRQDPEILRTMDALGLARTPENYMKMKRAGAVQVNMNDRKLQMGRFDRFSQQADVARDLVPELQTLSELAQAAPSGAIQGRLAEAFPGFSTAGDAFQSVISRVAPKMRVPGSGAASDKDVDLLRASLGSLRNTPGANQLIYQAFMDKANLEIERGNISDQVIFGEITPQAGLAKLREMDQRSIISPQLRALLDQLKGGRAVTPSGSNPAAPYFQ